MNHGIIIFGASGSGTTTLGREIAGMLNFAHLDADDFFWQESEVPFTIKRPREERISKLLSAIKNCRGFVISGSICGWDEPFLPLFDLAVYVTMPTEIRIERLNRRELKRFGSRILEGGDMYDNHREFIEWAATYDSAGTDQRSCALHEEWINRLSCTVLRVDGTQDYHCTAAQIAEQYYKKPGMDITIRLAMEKDAAELNRLNSLFNGEGNVSYEAIALSIRNNGQEQVFVSKCGDRIIGFCCIQLFKSFCYSNEYAEITELFVEEPYRRKSVATRLIAYAESYYSDKNIGGFQLFTDDENISAQKFYESIGYIKTNEIMYRKRK